MAIKKVNYLQQSQFPPPHNSKLTRITSPGNCSRRRPIGPNPGPSPRQTRHSSRAPRRRRHPRHATSGITLCPTGSIRARPCRYPRRRQGTSHPVQGYGLAEIRHEHGGPDATRLYSRGSQAACDGRPPAESTRGDSLRAYPASADGTGEMGPHCCPGRAG